MSRASVCFPLTIGNDARVATVRRGRCCHNTMPTCFSSSCASCNFCGTFRECTTKSARKAHSHISFPPRASIAGYWMLQSLAVAWRSCRYSWLCAVHWCVLWPLLSRHQKLSIAQYGNFAIGKHMQYTTYRIYTCSAADSCLHFSSCFPIHAFSFVKFRFKVHNAHMSKVLPRSVSSGIPLSVQT